MNIVEKFVIMKIRRLAYLSSCKQSKEESVTEESQKKTIVKRKILTKNKKNIK